jgi:DNA-binding XRE family transcriptional regulator
VLKKPSTPPLPALSVRDAHELEAVENNFARAIEHCFDAYGCIAHPVKVDAYMRSYVVKFFSIYLSGYASSNLPLWIPELKGKAIEWVLTVISNYRGVGQEQLREFFRNLDESLDEYLKAFGSSPSPILAALSAPAAYAAAGVDTDSKSPLLQKAMTRGTQQQVFARVPSHQGEPIQEAIPSPNEFSAELQKLLIDARLTPEAIADEVGIDWRTVYRHRNGEMLPSLKTLAAYEKALSRLMGRKIILPTPARRQIPAKKSGKRQ